MRRNDDSTLLEKGICVLQAFKPGDHPLRLSQIVLRTGLPKTTVHRLIRQLLELRLLTESQGRYEPGIAIFELSESVPVRYRIRDVALPFLHELHSQTGQTVHLGVRDGIDVVYAEKVSGRSGLQTPSRVGGRLPLNCTAVGKALLAYSESSWLVDFLGRPLRRLTPCSVTDPRKLAHQVKAIRTTGLAFDLEEAQSDLACIAAPIMVKGRALAAISVSATVEVIRSDDFEPHLRTAVRAISAELGKVPHQLDAPTQLGKGATRADVSS